jgi:hypothetical protein
VALSSAPPAAELSLCERIAGNSDNEQFEALIALMRRSSHGAGDVILKTGEPGTKSSSSNVALSR